MKHQFQSIAQSFKMRVAYYSRLYGHPDTPWSAKALLWLALGYALSPIDIIPDFIPIIGHLDDLVIVPALVLLALWLVPDEVKTECRMRADSSHLHNPK